MGFKGVNITSICFPDACSQTVACLINVSAIVTGVRADYWATSTTCVSHRMEHFQEANKSNSTNSVCKSDEFIHKCARLKSFSKMLTSAPYTVLANHFLAN